MKENKFQRELKKELKTKFPGCYILKTDPTEIQGMPDLLILYKSKWATLEVKANEKSSHRPNQDYRVKELDQMSFSRFIYPENKEEVIDEMARLFEENSSW